MNKFFAKKQKDDIFSFYDSDIHHILNVLRLKLDDKLIVFFESKKYLCKINNINPLLAKIVNEIPNDCELENSKISVFQAIIKPKHFEFSLIKSVELGIHEFYPVIFSRTQHNYIFKRDRYSNMLSSACKQCGRTNIPTLFNPIDFIELCNLLKFYEYVLVANEHNSNSENDLLSFFINNNISNNIKVAIVIGPEGGFSDNELNKLSSYKNVKFVGLTKSILRSETATCYMLSVIISYLIYKGNK